MARPKKNGLEYFSIDVDMENNDKIKIIEKSNGPITFAIIVKLLARIYKHGYYYSWGEKEKAVFSADTSLDLVLIENVITDCIKWDFFNKDMFEKFNILTSNSIQNRFVGATLKRDIAFINEKYLLLNRAESFENKKLRIVNDNGEYIEKAKKFNCEKDKKNNTENNKSDNNIILNEY